MQKKPKKYNNEMQLGLKSFLRPKFGASDLNQGKKNAIFKLVLTLLYKKLDFKLFEKSYIE